MSRAKRQTSLISFSGTSLSRLINYENCVPVLLEDNYAIRRMALFWLRNSELSQAARDFRDFVAHYHVINL